MEDDSLFQGVNPSGTTRSKGFSLWDSSQEFAPFSVDPQIPAGIRLQDGLPIGCTVEFWEFPLQHLGIISGVIPFRVPALEFRPCRDLFLPT